MKFTEHLGSHLTPEWRTQYIAYQDLKNLLLRAVAQKSKQSVDTDVLELQAEFFEACQEEIKKVNNFYSEKSAEARRKFTNFVQEYEAIHTLGRRLSFFPGNRKHMSIFESDLKHEAPPPMSHSSNDENRASGELINSTMIIRTSSNSVRTADNSNSQMSSVFSKSKHQFKLYSSELYLSLVLLQKYQSLNQTGFRKILKKHDKLFESTVGLDWFENYVLPTEFVVSKTTTKLIDAVEKFHIKYLEHGDRTKAMKQLRVPPLSGKANAGDTFRLGLFLGIFVIEVALIFLYLIKYNSFKMEEAAIRLFRDSFLLILSTFLFGVNLWGWRISGVNNVLIFELDPRHFLSSFQIMVISLFFASIWGGLLIIFVVYDNSSRMVFTTHFVVTLVFIIVLMFPFKYFYYTSRVYFLKALLHIFTAPFHSVRFIDFWLADQLTSLSILFPDLVYFICFYAHEFKWAATTSSNPEIQLNSTHQPDQTDAFQCKDLDKITGPLLSALPFWFRFAQCIRRYYDQRERVIFPHIVNAGKYSTGFLNLISSYIFIHQKDIGSFTFYIITHVISMVFRYGWDILMDFGFVEKTDSNSGVQLREERIYHYRAYYYFVTIQNLLLRTTWMYSIIKFSVPTTLFMNNITFTALAILEVYRRFIWNFFRLENEHLNNCGDFRAVRDISIVPIDDTAQEVTPTPLHEPTELSIKPISPALPPKNKPTSNASSSNPPQHKRIVLRSIN